MGDNQQEDDELIMVDPTQDMINLWTSLIDHTTANSLKVHAENQLEVNLFKNGGAVNKGPNKRDARKRIKASLENSGFNPEQVRLAIENYAQNGEFMNLAIDKVDSKSTFMFDLDSEGWSTAIELERVGLLKKIEDVDFDRSVFEQAKEICMMNEYQKEFYKGYEAPLSVKKTSGPVEARIDITHQVEKGNEREKQAELRERSRNLNKEKEREKDKERERERINMENKKDKDNKENREINRDKERPSRKSLALDSSRSNSPEKIKKNRHLEDGEIYQNHRDNFDLFNEQEKEDKLHPPLRQAPYSKTHYKSKYRDDYVVTFSFISGQANSSKKPAVTPTPISTSASSLRERRPLSPKRVMNSSKKDICFEAEDIRPINRSRREICFVADDIRAIKQKPISKAPVVIEIDDYEERTPPKPKKKTDSSVVFVIDSDNDDDEDEEVIFGPLLSPDINPDRECLFSEDSDMELLSEGKISDKLKSHHPFQDKYNRRLQVPFEKLNTIAGLSSTFHIPSGESVNRPLQYISDQPQFISSQRPLQHLQGPYSTQTPHLQPHPHPHIHPHPHLHPQPHPQHQKYPLMPLGSFSPPRQNPSFYPSTRGPLPEPGIGGSYPGHGHSLPVKRHLSFTPPSHQNNHFIEKLGPGGRSFHEYRGSLANNSLPCPGQVIQPEDFEESPYFPLSMTTAEQIMRRKKDCKIGYDSPEPEPGEIMHERNVSPVRL